jgi:hypothetical protein
VLNTITYFKFEARVKRKQQRKLQSSKLQRLPVNAAQQQQKHGCQKYGKYNFSGLSLPGSSS